MPNVQDTAPVAPVDPDEKKYNRRARYVWAGVVALLLGTGLVTYAAASYFKTTQLYREIFVTHERVVGIALPCPPAAPATPTINPMVTAGFELAPETFPGHNVPGRIRAYQVLDGVAPTFQDAATSLRLPELHATDVLVVWTSPSRGYITVFANEQGKPVLARVTLDMRHQEILWLGLPDAVTASTLSSPDLLRDMLERGITVRVNEPTAMTFGTGTKVIGANALRVDVP